MRYTGPLNRLARREGMDLGLKTPGTNAHAQLLKRLKVPPGQHGQRGRRKVSDYGIQLREKQKVKRMYGVSESQFEKYFEEASREKGNTGQTLLILLERRLDNVVYRMNLAPTRSSARQFTTHGHVLVNGKKVSIPSYQIREGETVTIKQKMMEHEGVKKLMEEKQPTIVSWITKKGPVGKVTRLPVREDIADDINEQLIIEFYSR